MNESEFLADLEYKITAELKTRIAPEERCLWCDGIILENHIQNANPPYIVGKAWMGGIQGQSRSYQEVWEFVLILGNSFYLKEEIAWKRLLSEIHKIGWLNLDRQGRKLMVDCSGEIYMVEKENIMNEQAEIISNVVVLFRPVGQRELELVKGNGYRSWPPRLPEQPIFYPVTNGKYATEIAKQWNTKGGKIGYVTLFRVRKEFMERYEIHQVGASYHTEWWIPAEDLEELNENIIGLIEVIGQYS